MTNKEYDEIMKNWDNIRKLIVDGKGGSYPRDWFECLIQGMDEEIEELKAGIDKVIRKIEMFIKTRNDSYIAKALSLLRDIKYGNQ